MRHINLVTPLFNYIPGTLYDLVISSPAGNITMPNFVSFSGVPTIVTAVCRDPLLPINTASLACQVGETVTLDGAFLPPPSTAFTVTVFSGASQQNVSCANPRCNSEYQLACDMLVPGLPNPGGRDTWSMSVAQPRYDDFYRA